jgi:Xaa-Pro aminopeptidase
MVVTIEPGIYIEGESIGVRIEDDVLITRGAARVLTAHIPK